MARLFTHLSAPRRPRFVQPRVVSLRLNACQKGGIIRGEGVQIVPLHLLQQYGADLIAAVDEQVVDVQMGVSRLPPPLGDGFCGSVFAVSSGDGFRVRHFRPPISVRVGIERPKRDVNGDVVGVMGEFSQFAGGEPCA